MNLEPANLTTTPIPKSRARLIGVILAILFAAITIIISWGMLTRRAHQDVVRSVPPAETVR